MARYLVPLVIFVLLIVAFLFGLQNDPRKIPSALINKPVPSFTLQELHEPEQVITEKDFPATPFILNVWASWCTACLQEHPLLLALSKQSGITIYGLNYKDTREAALDWLHEHGDPYVKSLFDNNGDTGIELGVYGVPETFIVDQHGIIRYKHIGPVSEESMVDTILPLLNELSKDAT